MVSKIQSPCPRCQSTQVVKAGVVSERQRYKCKSCGYYYTVAKMGKTIDDYYIIKGLQLYLEGLSYREIERLLGVSHVTVMNWVKKYGVKKLEDIRYHPSYKILSHAELKDFIAEKESIKGHGLIITEVGDKFMVIKWDRFRD
ncbi:IS1/IS1595 family N-terminal zinc-binding domain-containing protein [Thermaurantimonas aggregans]|nr:IS1 family transposase [Thermaurantimonas aggregans]MCX8147903.1 helix-turn-helix domain-containing protein [Thermaurantimonas aggregans]